MARYRCIYLCIQHRFGTLNRISRCRCFQRYGDGTLGNTRLDDPYLRLGIRTVLFANYVLTKVAVTVYAGGLVFQQVFGIKELWGIDFFWIAAIGLVILTALYTIFGGMKS
eukprot:11535094-Prorocentrum_lima.AAC.1